MKLKTEQYRYITEEIKISLADLYCLLKDNQTH